jgi:Pyridoxamine 5'-phosphate oxidase
LSFSLTEEEQQVTSLTNSAPVPDQVLEVLKTVPIGYLSIASKKGDLYSYPMTFHYSGLKIYMMTPIASAKMKLMKANPNVSFLVDNKKLTLESCGAMVQGKAKILSMAKMIASIVSLGPKMAAFAKKYPGYFSFYAKGKFLPDERKLYKYRFVRIDPSKIVFWTGYNFGKYLPEKNLIKEEPKEDVENQSQVEDLAHLLATADEELEPDQIPADQDWLGELKSSSLLTDDEKQVIGSYKAPLGTEEYVKPGKLSASEKNILKKWKSTKASN